MNPGQITTEIQGIRGTEPAFGMEAVWVEAADRDRAETAGYTVVDCSTVVATHLTEIIRRHAPDFLGRQEVQELLELVAQRSPKLVEDLVPKALELGEVARVLKLLLAEEVSIRDMQSILEALADEAPRTRSIHELAETTRSRLSNAICQKASDAEGSIHAIMLDSPSDRLLRQHLMQTDHGPILSLDLSLAKRIIHDVQSFAVNSPTTPLLVVAPDLRRALSEMLRPFISQINVLSHQEVHPRKELLTIGTLSLTDQVTQNANASFGDNPLKVPST